jgi:hypothetical protein
LKEFRKSETLCHSKNDNIDSKLISIWLKGNTPKGVQGRYPDKVPSPKTLMYETAS